MGDRSSGDAKRGTCILSGCHRSEGGSGGETLLSFIDFKMYSS